MSRQARALAGFAFLAGAIASVALTLTAAACGDNAPARLVPTGDASSDDAALVPDATLDAGVDGSLALEAPHTPYPLITYGGGPVLEAPHLVVVTFAGDPMLGDVNAFATAVTTTDWYRNATSGACDDAGCVGPARQVDVVTLPLAPPPASDAGDAGVPAYDEDAVLGILHDALASGTVPPPDEDSLYLLAFPLGAVLTTQDVFMNTLTGCSSFAFYHHELYIGDIDFPAGTPGYDRLPIIALPRCSRLPVDLTVPLARALVATATDPAGTAYNLRDDEGWNAFYGTELPDLCQDDPPVSASGSGFDAAASTSLPRIWSNAASVTGDPCLPTDGQPYFAAAARTAATTLYLAASGSLSLPVDAFAEDDGGFSLEVADLDEILTGTPTLAATLDRSAVTNGDTVNLTVSFAHPPPERGFGVVIVFAERGTTSHGFPFAVRQL